MREDLEMTEDYEDFVDDDLGADDLDNERYVDYSRDVRRIDELQAAMPESLHEYFKKELPEFKILVQINPNTLTGLELIVSLDGHMDKTKRQFEPDIYEDLSEDEFEACSPLEFNLYLKGLAKQ